MVGVSFEVSEAGGLNPDGGFCCWNL